MREIFTREEDGVCTLIEVDLNAYGYSQRFGWLLSIFIKIDGSDETKDGYEEFLETKESLIIALEHEEKAKFVGMRVVDGWSELYFYTRDSKGYDNLVSKILTPSAYQYESHIVKDSKWDFHYKNLLPTEEELAHIQSEKIIFLLKEEGDDIEIARDVEHYLSFQTPTQKEKFIQTLDRSFVFKDEIEHEDFENAIAILHHQKVTSSEMKKVVHKLFELLQPYQGYYEGWSTVLAQEETL